MKDRILIKYALYFDISYEESTLDLVSRSVLVNTTKIAKATATIREVTMRVTKGNVRVAIS
ncbi:MAG: hypothetical protein GPJ50_09405 [Candidatus Heimdallarchaeota archaeon]|nr:hypothetical protein [Candidatus Heimdallarchaeota archaeon]